MKYFKWHDYHAVVYGLTIFLKYSLKSFSEGRMAISCHDVALLVDDDTKRRDTFTEICLVERLVAFACDEVLVPCRRMAGKVGLPLFCLLVTGDAH